MERPIYDRATEPSTGRAWAWTGLSGWREWSNRQADWLPSMPPPPGAERSQSPESRRQFGTIARCYRLISYHPTWGEDWTHYGSWIEAIEARARKLAHSPEVCYRIEEVTP